MVRIGTIGIAVMALVGVVLCAQADTRTPSPPPKSPTAVAAKTKYDADAKKAAEAYRKAVEEAYRAYIRELDAAKADALKRENLKEVEAIVREKQQAEQELARLNGRFVSKTYEIDATAAWTETISVQRGQEFWVKPVGDGQWRMGGGNLPMVGPEGRKEAVVKMVVEAPHGALLLKIGNGTPRVITKETRMVADRDGKVVLGPNDNKVEDNAGSLQVEIKTHGTPEVAPE